MLAESALESKPPAAAPSHHLTFFRQSGWMMIATVGSGVLMFLVHIYSKFIPESEYAVVATLIQVLNWMTIPTLGLQTVFAQQTAAAITEDQNKRLVGTFRAVLKWTFGIWLLMALGTLVFQSSIVTTLKISNPAALWVTVSVGLMMLWQPVFQGLLQGRQNFLWLGWVAVFNGIGRLFIAGLIVFVFKGMAAGIMTGALIGMIALVGTAAWQNRDFLTAPSASFEAAEWLRRVVPLTLGCGASQFLFSADMFIVQSNFKEVGAYAFGMTLARAIVLFTAPLVAVMFPRIVQGMAKSEKNNFMTLTFLVTAALACFAAIALPIVAPIAIKSGSKSDFISILPLMGLFAWAMVPLALGNVLLNSLLAQSRFGVVPWVVVTAVGYWITLLQHHESFKMVATVLLIFNVIFLVICSVFTWVLKPKPKVVPAT